MSGLDWAVFFGYGAAIFALGSYFARRGGESVAAYFVSGRTLPWWLAGASMAATSFAADTPLWITGTMRRGGGIAANWYWWSFLFGHVLAIFVFAPLWRRSAVLTNIEITEVRFSGRPAAALRLLKSVYLAVPINLGAVVWCTLAMQKILEATLGVSRFTAVALCLAFSAGYCVLSGLWGVVATDLLQLGIGLLGALALAWAAVSHAGGISGLEARLAALYGPDHNLFALVPSGDILSPAMTGFFTYTLVLWWSSRNVDGGGALVQRMLACKDERHATGATLFFTLIHYTIRTWPWVLAALASFVFFPLAGTGAGADPALAAYAARVAGDPEFAYPAMIALLPAGLRGLLLASLFAAFASTVDSFLNLSASYLLNDLYRRFLRPEAPERHYLRVSRLFVAVLAVAATAVSYWARSIDQVFSFLLAFSGGIGLVYIGRWFWWRVNAFSEIAAMLASGAAATALSFVSWKPACFDATPFRLVATVAITAAVTLAVTLLSPPEDRETLLGFYRRVRPGGLWGPIRAEAGIGPETSFGARTVGRCLAALALVLGATGGSGKLIFGEIGTGVALFGLAAAGGAALFGLTAREAAGIIPEKTLSGRGSPVVEARRSHARSLGVR
jgi:Na+/proline symporter